MCRLYGFISTHPTKVECELIQSQNSLLHQSETDMRGEQNPHGWGLGNYQKSEPHVVKEPEPAFESDEFRWLAANVSSTLVISHVRRATVGIVSMENTHPFAHHGLMIAHNGHIEQFDLVREKLISAMSDEASKWIQGSTDSEYILAYAHHVSHEDPEASLATILIRSLRDIIAMIGGVDPDAESALNVVFSNGDELAASCYNRSLYMVERDAVHPCQVCAGALHVEEMPESYRAVILASEPITTDEEWQKIPNRSIVEVDSILTVSIRENALA